VPRLSKGDAGHIVRALRHFLGQTEERPDPDQLAKILHRLTQRVDQPNRTWRVFERRADSWMEPPAQPGQVSRGRSSA